MQIVQCEVAIGGDRRNTVPRFGVTIAELALLQAIHGQDAVFDIEPTGERHVATRVERDRLRELYRARNEEGEYLVELTYPGSAPRIPTKLDDLGLPPELFTRAYQNKLEAGGVKISSAVADAAPDDAEDDLPEIDAEPDVEDTESAEEDPTPVARRRRAASVME